MSSTSDAAAARPVRSAPDDTAIQVIRRLREAGHQVAAVFNENGRPIGIVSIEDMVGRLTLSGV